MIKKYKLAVFDIDGTLTIKDDIIPKSTIDTINKLKENGINCIIATGRSKKAVDDILVKTGIENFISLNGQYISWDGEVIYKYTYPKEVVERIKEVSNKVGAHYVLTNERGYYVPEVDKILAKHTSSVLKEKNLIKDLEPNEAIHQVEVYCDESSYKEFEFLKEDYNFTTWHTGGFDIVRKGRSKSCGIEEIRKFLEIDKEEIIAFGDGNNDIDMIDYVGMGIAMGNATDKVKAVSNLITDDVDKDGIFKACKKLNLI